MNDLSASSGVLPDLPFMFVMCVIVVLAMHELLQRSDTPFFCFEQAFQMLTRINETLRADLAFFIEQYGIRQLADLIRKAEFLRQHIRILRKTGLSIEGGVLFEFT